jgi:hypothetical protein
VLRSAEHQSGPDPPWTQIWCPTKTLLEFAGASAKDRGAEKLRSISTRRSNRGMFVRLAVFANYGRYDLGSPVAPHATGHGRHPRLPRDLLLVLELDGRGPGELCDRLLRDCDSHHFALWRREAPYRLNVGASIMFGSRHGVEARQVRSLLFASRRWGDWARNFIGS